MLTDYIWAFIIGGLFCAAGQILIDFTKLTPAKILVSFAVIGVVLNTLGIYEPLVKLAGAGATVPLTGFGYLLSKGVFRAISKDGFIGVITGGLSAVAGGITAVMVFALMISVFFKRGDKMT